MRTRIAEMIFPEQANHYGTLFGGHALSLMAKAAFVEATRHARCNVVMARTEQVDFATPIRVGEILDLEAQVIRSGRSSMTVAVQGRVEARSRSVLTGRFVMVAVDCLGRPQSLASALNDKEHDHDIA